MDNSNNADILCIQETKTSSNSFFKYGSYLCVSSTHIQGGEKPHKSTFHKTPKALPGEAPPRKRTTPEDHPTYLAARIIKKSESNEHATEYLAYVESRIGVNTRANRIFTIEDVTEAFIKCEEHFDALENPPEKGKGKGKGAGKGDSKTKNADPENHVSRQGIARHHGIMFM